MKIILATRIKFATTNIMAFIAPQKITLKSGKQVLLQSPTEENVDAYLEYRKLLSIESENTYHYPGMPMPRDKEIENLRNMRDMKRACLIAAFDGERIVGVCGLTPVKINHPWTEHLAYMGMGIIKEYWGQGLASSLLHVHTAYAKKFSYTKIEANVRESNEAALQVYLEEGYRVSGKRLKGTLIRGSYNNEFYIEKDLESESWRPPSIESSRLIIRPLRASDAESIFAYARDPEVAKYTLWEPHRDVLETKKWIRTFAYSSYDQGNYDPLGICLKNQKDMVIGTVGARKQADGRCFELAYALGRKHWGQGIATEASRALIDYLFTHTNAHKITSHFKEENTASGKVMQKLGMEYEGTLKEHLYHRGRYWNLVFYGLRKS